MKYNNKSWIYVFAFLILVNTIQAIDSNITVNSYIQTSVGNDTLGVYGSKIKFVGQYANYTIDYFNLSSAGTWDKAFIVNSAYQPIITTTNITGSVAYFAENKLLNNTVYYVLVQGTDRRYNNADVPGLTPKTINGIEWTISACGINVYTYTNYDCTGTQRIFNIWNIGYSEYNPVGEINLTVRKESDGSIIYLLATIGVLSDSGISTTTYINGSGLITVSTPDNYTISAVASGYNTRYQRINVLNQSSQNLDMYLNNGTNILFNFETSTGTVLPGAELSIYRTINGVSTLVEQRVSDISGIAQVSLETTGVYTFQTYLDGYNNYSFTLNPVIYTSYDVVLTPLSSGNDVQPSALVTFSPTSFYRFQNVNFNIEFLSQYDNLQSYNYTLTYPSTTYSNGGTNTHGEEFTTTFNLGSAVQGSTMQIFYEYTLSNGLYYNNTLTYNIAFINSNRTWVNLGNNINATTGQDDITGYFVGERVIIVTIISIILFGVGWSVGGATTGLLLALIPILFFTQSGFVPKQLYYVTIVFIIFYIIGKGSDT